MNLRGCLSPGLVGLFLCSSGLTREAPAAEGRQLRGALYALDSRQKVKLYTWEMTVCPELWTSRYRRLDGSLVAIDPIEVRLSRTGQFKGIRGRTIITELSGERLVPIDADLIVEAERPGTCTPATPTSFRRAQ